MGQEPARTINWGFLAPLASRYRLVALDLPGSGDSDDAVGPLEYDDLCARVLAVASAADADRFHLLGYSLGAHLAAATAARRPAGLLSLTAIAGWVRPDPYMLLEFDLWQRLHALDPALFASFAVLTGSHPEALSSSTPADVRALVDGFTPILARGTSRQAEFVGRTDLSGAAGAARRSSSASPAATRSRCRSTTPPSTRST